jgi:adenylate kinase
MPPKVAGKCDKCGGELFRRVDDQPDVIRERLRVYREASAPVVDYYQSRNLIREVRNENPNADPDEVVNQIIEIIR